MCILYVLSEISASCISEKENIICGVGIYFVYRLQKVGVVLYTVQSLCNCWYDSLETKKYEWNNVNLYISNRPTRNFPQKSDHCFQINKILWVFSDTGSWHCINNVQPRLRGFITEKQQ